MSGRAFAPDSKIIMHVDMDAFFASVEQRDNPVFREKPVIVGSDPKEGEGRGVVSTASYEARKFGIRSAMPISKAYRLCPGGIFLRPRMDRYIEVSRQIMEIFLQFSPTVEAVSIDEAFLDLSGMERLMGDSEKIARETKRKIFLELGLSCSAGVASSKFVAKIASDLKKPDGLVICPFGEEKKFLAPLPIEKLWGVGEKTALILHRFGIRTIGDIADSSPTFLKTILKNRAEEFQKLACGIDQREVQPDRTRKSVSEEHTFEKDVDSDSIIEHYIFRIAESVSRQMRNMNITARTVTMKIRLQDFETFSRSETLSASFDRTDTIRQTALRLYREFPRNGKAVRLIGVAVSNLNSDTQLELFSGALNENGQRENRSGKTDILLDRLQKQFGPTIKRGAFIQKSSDRENEQ